MYIRAMRPLLLFVLITLSGVLFGQNYQIANSYFERGDFEKAELAYQDLHQKTPSNTLYFDRLIDCYHQLQKYELAVELLEERVNKNRQYLCWVDLGYTYQLAGKPSKADKCYQRAIKEIEKRPGLVYSIGKAFEKRSLIDWALLSYETAQAKNPNANYNFQMALLYGQQGKTNQMIELLLDEAFAKPNQKGNIQNYLSRFMAEDVEGDFKSELRKALLLRAQTDKAVFWNQFLSWYFVQNKEFAKAFRQQKAVVRREPNEFRGIVNLAFMAIDEKDHEAIKEIASFILEQEIGVSLRLRLTHELLSIRLSELKAEDYPIFEKEIADVLYEYGDYSESTEIKVLAAHFQAFYNNQPDKAIALLNDLLGKTQDLIQKSKIKMELADVLVLQEQFNRALIYYSQVELDLKNNPIGHEARFKVAKTSYYKGDFDWALKQVKVLKASETQLIANDALELFLLITDNNQIDSTYAALKAFAKADFKKFQRKTQESIQAFEQIKTDFPNDGVNEPAAIRLGQLYASEGKMLEAIKSYEYIIENATESVYLDEAYYYAGLLYLKLQQTEKAKAYFEKVIVNHPDSIFYNKSQYEYRTLRGDTNF